MERQRGRFRREERFCCPEHRIYISPSTYDHQDFHENLLQIDQSDRTLLKRVFAIKRETNRLGRERSEDALTFNVFRALERHGVLDVILSRLSGEPESGSTPSYWSFSLEAGSTHPLLAAARIAFGEADGRGSEPDLILDTPRALFVVEAKLGSRNETTPSRSGALGVYRRAEGNWYDSVFRTDPAVVATELKLYQLMRLWLLGTWMAHRSAKRLVLVNLTPAANERDVTSRFGPHIVTSDSQQFLRCTWESIREQARAIDRPGLEALVEYLGHKTLGFDGSGVLQLAFENSEGG